MPQEPLNPGASPGVVPEETEQGTGRRFEEVMAREENEIRFRENALVGAFGTLKKPVLVPSTMSERVVGCMGTCPGSGVLCVLIYRRWQRWTE